LLRIRHCFGPSSSSMSSSMRSSLIDNNNNCGCCRSATPNNNNNQQTLISPCDEIKNSSQFNQQKSFLRRMDLSNNNNTNFNSFPPHR
jgi:hypothetical protein